MEMQVDGTHTRLNNTGHFRFPTRQYLGKRRQECDEFSAAQLAARIIPVHTFVDDISSNNHRTDSGLYHICQITNLGRISVAATTGTHPYR